MMEEIELEREKNLDELEILGIRSEKLKKMANERLNKARSTTPARGSDLLIKQSPVISWGKNNKFDKNKLIRQFIKYYPKMGRNTDEACMRRYLNNVMVTGLNNTQLGSMSEFLPAGAPLVDFLAVYQEFMDSWKYPLRSELEFCRRNRGLSFMMLNEIEVREIEVGVTTPSDIRETVEWFWSWQDVDQKAFPSNVVSMDNEEIRISLYDVYRMIGRIEFSGSRVIARELETSIREDIDEEDRWQQLPVKMMIGNGFRQALMISINLDRDSKDRYLVKKLTVQAELVDFLETIPVCVGLGVQGDVDDINHFYSLFSGRRVQMKGYIDLGVLATLAGWELYSKDMTTMGVQVCGTILNKCCSTGDGKWAWQWAKIPAALRVYALGDLRFGHMTYITLAGILMADLFPDPEICCKFLGVFQFEACRMILSLIRVTLNSIGIAAEEARRADNRVDLIKCLRYKYDDGLGNRPPGRIMLWVALLGDWPTITQGGARHLIQAREWFITQAEILEEAQLDWDDGFVFPKMSQEMELYARFGIDHRYITECDWLDPASSDSGVWLNHPESFLAPRLQTDPVRDNPGCLSTFCKKNLRIQKFVLCEWARRNPNNIQDMIKRMKMSNNLQKYYKNTYDALRLLFRRIFDKPALRIDAVDEKLVNALYVTLQQEIVERNKTEQELKCRNNRVQFLTELIEAEDTVERTRWRESIPKLPEWKIRRGGRKRGRSVSRSPAGSRSRKQVKLGPAHLGDEQECSDHVQSCSLALTVADPIPGLDSGRKAPRLVGAGDMNEKVPVVIRQIPRKAKKSRRKKTPGRVLTHDEQVEGRTSAELDLDLEMEFFESLK